LKPSGRSDEKREKFCLKKIVFPPDPGGGGRDSPGVGGRHRLFSTKKIHRGRAEFLTLARGAGRSVKVMGGKEGDPTPGIKGRNDSGIDYPSTAAKRELGGGGRVLK